jgi:hypothetical protein
LVKPVLTSLSQEFGEAQYFCTRAKDELCVWARARQGRLVRGYGWHGIEGATLWDEGKATEEERSLGVVFSNGRNAEGVLPDETSVLQIASFWSINPWSIDEAFQEPHTGLLGNIGQPAEAS